MLSSTRERFPGGEPGLKQSISGQFGLLACRETDKGATDTGPERGGSSTKGAERLLHRSRQVRQVICFTLEPGSAFTMSSRSFETVTAFSKRLAHVWMRGALEDRGQGGARSCATPAKYAEPALDVRGPGQAVDRISSVTI